jgi:serine/threonine-protein kinase PknK
VTLRVVIAEDEVLLREGLARLLGELGFHVAALAGTADEALAAVREHQPDVLLADIRMPPTRTDEGFQVAEAMREDCPQVGVLILSQHAAVRAAIRLLEHRRRGVGYLLKQRVSEVGVLAEALRRVAAGGAVVDPLIARALVDGARRKSPLADLSERELELLALMAEGRSNSAAAKALGVSPKTVETHAHAIFTKLGLQRTEDDNRRVLAVLTFLRAAPR